MGRQQLLLSLVKPLILLNMKEWRLGWEHKFFLATLIASQVIGVISAFDCRFFIFHPECRGQYGKRSTLPALAQQQQLPNTIPNDQYPNQDLNPDTDAPMKILLDYCSRYVFAPICRGVTSKRATISPLVGNNHAIYDLILKQIKKQQEDNKYNSEQVKEDTKDIDSDLHSANELKPRKRDSWDLNDLGSFTSFYRKRLYKRNAPYLDDLDTFTSFFKKKRRNNVDDLGLFTTFYKKNDPKINLLQQQRNNAIDDLNSFTTFYKRDQGTGPGSRFRRQALDDLEAFTTFMKKDNIKRSPRSISREALRDSLGTFSSFMDPYQYYKRTPNSNHAGSSSIG